MRVAILSESSADAAGIRILAEGLLLCQTVPVVPELRAPGGWSGVLNILATTIRFLHYRTDADGLIVVVDSNHTSLTAPLEENRLHALQKIAAGTIASLGHVLGKPPLRVTVGVASPAIEAWLLCYRRPEFSEAAWEKGLVEKSDPYSRPELKGQLYGTERPTLQVETQKMVEAARELCNNLALIEEKFPLGFGGMARTLRDWRRVGS